MTRARNEIIVGLAFVAAYVVLFHFLRSLPLRVTAVISWTTVLIPIALDATGWWRWRGTWREENTARWRRIAGLLCLLANTLAASLFWISFFYGSFVVSVHHSNGFRGIDLEPVVYGCLMLSVASLAIGLLVPRGIRLAVVLGSFSMSWLILGVIGSAGVL